MSYLLDTNILLRSIQKTHQLHAVAAGSVEELLSQGVPLCITAQNLIEFWSVSTRAAVHNGLGLSSQETGAHVGAVRRLSRRSGIVSALRFSHTMNFAPSSSERGYALQRDS
jgi:hypothetical protein